MSYVSSSMLCANADGVAERVGAHRGSCPTFIWTCGDGRYGQLGLPQSSMGPESRVTWPTQVPMLARTPLRAVSAGGRSSFAITANDELYFWGHKCVRCTLAHGMGWCFWKTHTLPRRFVSVTLASFSSPVVLYVSPSLSIPLPLLKLLLLLILCSTPHPHPIGCTVPTERVVWATSGSVCSLSWCSPCPSGGSCPCPHPCPTRAWWRQPAPRPSPACSSRPAPPRPLLWRTGRSGRAGTGQGQASAPQGGCRCSVILAGKLEPDRALCSLNIGLVFPVASWKHTRKGRGRGALLSS